MNASNGAYPGRVMPSRESWPTLEDERGVDVARIRELLAMTPAERVARMVAVVNAMQSIRDSAKTARQGTSSLPYLESLQEARKARQ